MCGGNSYGRHEAVLCSIACHWTQIDLVSWVSIVRRIGCDEQGVLYLFAEAEVEGFVLNM